MSTKSINCCNFYVNMEYVRKLSPKPDKILVCHGDAYKALDLASSIYRTYKIETKTPLNLETTRLQ